MSSDTQMVGFGLYALSAGTGLIFAPQFLLNTFSPLTNLIERLTGLGAMVAPTAVNGTGPATTAAGALAAAIGLYYLLAVATGDEKFKRNTVPGRLFFAATILAACKYTPHGSSFLALVGAGDALGAVLMGSSVGFGGAFGGEKTRRD